MGKDIIWPLILLAYASMFCVGFADNIRGPVFPHLLHEYNLSDGFGAWFFTVASFMAFIGTALSHQLVKIMDRVQGIRVSLFIFIGAQLFIGWSFNYGLTLVGAGMLGMSFGLIGLLQNVLVTVAANQKRRQQLITGLHAVYGFSSLMAPFLVVYVMNTTTHWRDVFRGVAILPVFVLLFTLTFKKKHFVLSRSKESVAKHQRRLWTRDKLFMATILSIYTMVELMVTTRLSLYLQRYHQYSTESSSLSLSYFYGLFLLGRVLFSLIHWSIPLRRQISILLFLTCLSLILGYAIHPMFLILTGFFMAPCYPFCVGYMTEIYSEEMDSMMFVAFMVQATFVVSMHSSVGYLSDWIGLDKALWLGPIFILIAFLMQISYESLFSQNKKSLLKM